jgi:hypothetical protein
MPHLFAPEAVYRLRACGCRRVDQPFEGASNAPRILPRMRTKHLFVQGSSAAHVACGLLFIKGAVEPLTTLKLDFRQLSI